MGRDRHYVHGDFYRVDDRTGFPERARNTRKEWTGLIMHKDRWEYRHPQDFVKGVFDDQTVPEPRPLTEDPFVMQNAAGAMFKVWRDNATAYWLILQTVDAFNIGNQPGSNWQNTNPAGTAGFEAYGGDTAPVAYPPGATFFFTIVTNESEEDALVSDVGGSFIEP